VAVAVDPASLRLDWLAGPLAFLVTDIDDLFVLVAFFADALTRPRHVVIGQYAGIAFLIAVSCLAMLFRLVVPVPVIGLLGALPLVLGIREAVELARTLRGSGDDDDDPRRAGPTLARRPGIIGLALVTIANGGDNIAVYAPLFASSTPVRAAGLAGIFLAMTGVWLCLAWITVHNPLFGRHLQRWGRRLLPPVLILLGVLILWENGTFAWLAGLVAGVGGGT
jgi:cadmium resistance protein CadD (predicted permease)